MRGLLRICLLSAFFTFITGCGLPSFSLFSSPKGNIDSEAIENDEKALVLFRAVTPDGSPVETHWLNRQTGEEIKLSSQFFAMSGEPHREYDPVALEPGEYVLIYAGYGGLNPRAPFKMDPQAGPYSDLGQVVVTESTLDDRKTYLYALTSPGVDDSGKALLASFSVNAGEVNYLGDMSIEFTYANPEKLPAGHFSAESTSIGIVNQRTRAKNALLELHPELAAEMCYRPFTVGKLAVRR